MIVVRNKLKKVCVLKAIGFGVLRLLPGYNNVDMKNLNAFTKGNPAAAAMVKDHLTIVDQATLDADEKKAAAAAKKKNDKLNKSAVALKAAQSNLIKAEKKLKGSDKAVSDLQEENAGLKDKMEELESKMEELLATKPEGDK